LAEKGKKEQILSDEIITGQGKVVVMREEKDMFSSDFQMPSSDQVQRKQDLGLQP
jgi:hypothetical protein